MKKIRMFILVTLILIMLSGCAQSQLAAGPGSSEGEPAAPPTAAPTLPALGPDNPEPPAEPVRLVFVHHSTGGNWLAAGLGQALMDNNYYASATNYGWGPDGIGDTTDIGHWWRWFRSPASETYVQALYTVGDQNVGDYGEWPRLAQAPAGENTIIMIKSCFPNSALRGSIEDTPPPINKNRLREQDAWSKQMTVANARGIYIDLLEYFRTRPDKLFIVITAPPLIDGTYSANARAFNNWLVNDWLAGYPLRNVAVFDYYNVLTSNGGDPETNDMGAETGNHHRWWNGAIQHVQATASDSLAYPSGDDHPNWYGNEKATSEFVPWLNVMYHRWESSQD